MSILETTNLLALVEPQGTVAQAVLEFPENAWCRRFGRAQDVLKGDNRRFRKYDLSTQMEEPDATIKTHLSLGFNPGPKDLSKGFVFGSDPETCDVLLAKDKNTGISGNHFSIHVDWQSGSPLITCLAPNESNGIRISSELDDFGLLFLRNEWHVIRPGTSSIIIVAGNMRLVVHNPDRPGLTLAYNANVKNYFKRCQDDVPEMAYLKVFDPEPTPLLLSRGRGLFGTEYYASRTIVKEMVVLCEAKRQHKGRESAETLIVKCFRKVRMQWGPHAESKLCLLQGLRHRRIITPEDIITDGSEYLPVYLPDPPRSLANRHIYEHALTEADTGEIVVQIFQGLEFLHAHDIVHGGLSPESIKIERSRPWSIKLTDVGLHPYVELENRQDQSVYASQTSAKGRVNGFVKPEPVWDTWSAGVVALELLCPYGLPNTYPMMRSQIHWVKEVSDHAKTYFDFIKPSFGSRQLAALFLTRVLKVEFHKRLTAEECLQDQWLLWYVQEPHEINRATFGHGQARSKDEKNEDPKHSQTAVHNGMESPGSTVFKGKQPARPILPRPSDATLMGQQLGARCVMPDRGTATSNGKQPESSRHASITAPTSSGISKSGQPENSRRTSSKAPTSSSGMPKDKQPPKPHYTSSVSSTTQHRQRSTPAQNLPSSSHGSIISGFTSVNRPANTTRQRSESPSARFYARRASPSGNG